MIRKAIAYIFFHLAVWCEVIYMVSKYGLYESEKICNIEMMELRRKKINADLLPKM